MTDEPRRPHIVPIPTGENAERLAELDQISALMADLLAVSIKIQTAGRAGDTATMTAEGPELMRRLLTLDRRTLVNLCSSSLQMTAGIMLGAEPTA